MKRMIGITSAFIIVAFLSGAVIAGSQVLFPPLATIVFVVSAFGTILCANYLRKHEELI